MKDSYVLGVLKRRIYHGKAHDTKLDDLKIASKEILDYYDDVIESSVKFAQQQLLTELLSHAREYEITDLEMLEHNGETPLIAVPVSVIERYREGLHE